MVMTGVDNENRQQFAKRFLHLKVKLVMYSPTRKIYCFILRHASAIMEIHRESTAHFNKQGEKKSNLDL